MRADRVNGGVFTSPLSQTTSLLGIYLENPIPLRLTSKFGLTTHKRLHLKD